MVPKLKLALDVKADTENCIYFVKNESDTIPSFLDMFLPKNFRYITSKKFSSSERNKIITEYTKHIYKINKKDITDGVNDTKKRWKKIESRFYKLVNRIFQGHPWPKGSYTGMASIYLMYPRNIQKKTFYFPYKNVKFDPLGVITHEMLHFIFFDFIKKKYKLTENSKFRGKNAEYVWQVSETFNNTIENWKPYKELFMEDSKPYPGCEEMFKAMKKQWNKKPEINSFLDKWLLKENF